MVGRWTHSDPHDLADELMRRRDAVLALATLYSQPAGLTGGQLQRLAERDGCPKILQNLRWLERLGLVVRDATGQPRAANLDTALFTLTDVGHGLTESLVELATRSAGQPPPNAANQH